MATKKTTTTTTTRKRSSGTVTKYGILKGCSYFALVIAATMFLIGGIFTGSVASIINLIAKLFVLIGIGIAAYDYTRGKKTAWRVIYWIALVVYVLGCVFGVMGGLIK